MNTCFQMVVQKTLYGNKMRHARIAIALAIVIPVLIAVLLLVAPLFSPGACQPLCGDGNCSMEGENCTSCPSDCGECLPSGEEVLLSSCGNDVCDKPTETCSNCLVDCGLCPMPKEVGSTIEETFKIAIWGFLGLVLLIFGFIYWTIWRWKMRKSRSGSGGGTYGKPDEWVKEKK